MNSPGSLAASYSQPVDSPQAFLVTVRPLPQVKKSSFPNERAVTVPHDTTIHIPRTTDEADALPTSNQRHAHAQSSVAVTTLRRIEACEISENAQLGQVRNSLPVSSGGQAELLTTYSQAPLHPRLRLWRAQRNGREFHAQEKSDDCVKNFLEARQKTRSSGEPRVFVE
jgi:hypothetical protein